MTDIASSGEVPRRTPDTSPRHRSVPKADTQQPNAGNAIPAQAAPAWSSPQMAWARPRAVFFVVRENWVATATDGGLATLYSVPDKESLANLLRSVLTVRDWLVTDELEQPLAMAASRLGF